MIEELAVGAQFKLPYIHMVVNNSYLGLIRQSQRGFSMDYCVQLGFDNINAPRARGLRRGPQEAWSKAWAASSCACTSRRRSSPPSSRPRPGWPSSSVPVVIEVMLERVTNISMGTEIDAINEFEELAASIADAPTAVGLLD